MKQQINGYLHSRSDSGVRRLPPHPNNPPNVLKRFQLKILHFTWYMEGMVHRCKQSVLLFTFGHFVTYKKGGDPQ